MSLYQGKDTSLLLQVLRIVRGWDQQGFATAAGISQGTISRYESGERVRNDVLVRLIAATGLSLSWVERHLLPVLRAARMRAAAAETQDRLGVPRTLSEDVLSQDQGALADAIREAIDVRLTELEANIEAIEIRSLSIIPSPSSRDREEAARAWGRLATCTAADRRFLVGECAEFQTWALAERLCHESEIAAAVGAAPALELARLAIAVAQLTKGSEPWRQRLLGYAQVFLAVALHLAGDPAAATAQLAAAWKIWRDGAAGDPSGLLEEWRLLHLEASQRLSERRFEAALNLLEQAAAVAPPHALGQIELQRASIQEQLGDRP